MGLLCAGIVGLVTSLSARSIMPGSDPLRVRGSIGIGIGGALLGYLLLAFRSANNVSLDWIGMSGAMIGAILTLFFYRSFALRYGY